MQSRLRNLGCVFVVAAIDCGHRQAEASVHWGGNDINIPALGVQLNVVTGANGLSFVPDWTINPWGGTGLNFWVSTSQVETEHIVRVGGGAIARLQDNDVIGPIPIYGGWSGENLPALTTGNQAFYTSFAAINNIGFRFKLSDGWHYGWARILVGFNLSPQYPRYIVEYAWEDQPDMPIWFFPEVFGVCCMKSTCMWTTLQSCVQFSPGTWLGGGTNCSLNPCPCQADVAPPLPQYGNGVVGLEDLLLVINRWGPCSNPVPPGCPGDATYNGIVDINDLLFVISEWGACAR